MSIIYSNTQYILADYFGIPTDVNLEWNALPFRGYHMIWSEFFRDSNLQDPLNIYLGDADRIFGNYYDEDLHEDVDVSLDERYPYPRNVNRYHDYFSSALPGIQKGDPVKIPLDGMIPVVTKTLYHDQKDDTALQMRVLDTDPQLKAYPYNDSGTMKITSTDSMPSMMLPTNLWADLGLEGYGLNTLSSTIEELRNAFMIQHLLEIDAISGTRYREILRAHFGVVSPDGRLQIPEYLGGNRIALNVHEVVNQSEGENAFLGNLGAMSHTADYNEDVEASFTEHGFIIGVCCVRYDNSYAQGLARMWSRKGRYSYYWPALANLGSQAILNREIYAQGLGVTNPDTGKDYDEEVFGYSEAWAEYRYAQPNLITAEMRPQATNSLASWHLSDYYESMPYLSDDWMQVKPDIVDRVLAVNHSNANQIFADFYVENICSRVMPLYSIPGMNGIL